jgi:hypothetical protein
MQEHAGEFKESITLPVPADSLPGTIVAIAQLKKDFRATVAQLTTRLDEQASQIQKVTTQLEGSKNTPQVVNNP